MNRLSLTIACCILSWATCQAAEPLRLVHRWEHEPDLGTTWLDQPTFPTPVLRPERISSPQLEIRLAEAQLVLRNARNPLLQGREAALQALLEQLKIEPTNRPLFLSQVAAAIALAGPDQASFLWERLRNEDATRPLIERALIDWKQPLALAGWRERLQDPNADQWDLLLAIEGVGVIGDQQDQAALVALLRDDRLSAATKIVVARALAQIAPSGLESLAQDALSAELEHRELLAAELLSQHSSAAARDILQRILLADSLPAQTVAYAAIAEHFPELAHEFASDLLRRPDNNLRLKASEVLNRYDDVASLRALAVGIADTNLLVRNTVREYLLSKAELPELRAEVDEVITYQLNGPTHYGIEQAVLMAVALGERHRTPQLLALLEHPRPEITIVAAWALQELANTPEVMQSILDFTQRVTQRLVDGDEVTLLQILRQSFLFEALGRNEYEPATEMLRIYVPKNGHKMGDMARASAIWALGKILQGSEEAALAEQLAQRMLDENPSDPEFELVRYNAILALGWIGAPASVDQLQRILYRPPSPLGMAWQWSTEQF